MKTTIAPAAERDDTTQEAAEAPSAAAATYTRASALTRDLTAQLAEKRAAAATVVAEAQRLIDAEAAEQGALQRAAAEATQIGSTLADARMRAQLVQGTNGQPAADARVQQIEAELAAATERATDAQTAISAAAEARDAQRAVLQSEHDTVQAQIVGLEAEHASLKAARAQAWLQLGQEEAEKIEREISAARERITAAEYALDHAQYALHHIQDGIVKRLARWPALAQQVDESHGREPELPRDPRRDALRAHLAVLDALGQAGQWDDTKHGLHVIAHVHDAIALRSDVAAEIFRRTGDERESLLADLRRQTHYVLDDIELDLADRAALRSARARRRRLAGES
jgi:predicted  nucleic acid-binding Zn-ribbon protein